MIRIGLWHDLERNQTDLNLVVLKLQQWLVLPLLYKIIEFHISYKLSTETRRGQHKRNSSSLPITSLIRMNESLAYTNLKHHLRMSIEKLAIISLLLLGTRIDNGVVKVILIPVVSLCYGVSLILTNKKKHVQVIWWNGPLHFLLSESFFISAHGTFQSWSYRMNTSNFNNFSPVYQYVRSFSQRIHLEILYRYQWIRHFESRQFQSILAIWYSDWGCSARHSLRPRTKSVNDLLTTTFILFI